MQRHCDHALAVAQWLVERREVAWVSYPGLPGDRYHNLAKKYVPKGAGACFTFGLKGGYDAGVRLVSDVKLFSHLANIGDTRSLIIHPASTTHRQLTDAQKIQAGAGPDVVRLSIGLEAIVNPTAADWVDGRIGRATKERLGKKLRRGGATHDLHGSGRERNSDEEFRHPDAAAIAGHQPPVGGAREHTPARNSVTVDGGNDWRRMGEDRGQHRAQSG